MDVKFVTSENVLHRYNFYLKFLGVYLTFIIYFDTLQICLKPLDKTILRLLFSGMYIF
jgi:hypothetical protein